MTAIDVLTGNLVWVDTVNGATPPASTVGFGSRSERSLPPAQSSIDAAWPVNVWLCGTVMANLAKSANGTFIAGASRFDVDSEVR